MLPLHRPQKALSFARGLTLSAQDHAEDQGKNGVFTHTGTDASNPWARMGRYGTWKGVAAENMGTGYNSGVDIVRQLLSTSLRCAALRCAALCCAVPCSALLQRCANQTNVTCAVMQSTTASRRAATARTFSTPL